MANAIGQPTVSARGYVGDEILRDGASVHLRAVRPADEDLIHDHFHRLSKRSVYFRYFNSRRELPASEVFRMTHVDYTRRVALLAVVRREEGEDLIGIGVYEQVKGSPWRADVAFSVLDDHQGRGVGTVLLEHLAQIARGQGITEFQASVLGENRRMLEVFQCSGYEVERRIENGVFTVRFPTAETLASFEAAFERKLVATEANVGRALPPPRSRSAEA